MPEIWGSLYRPEWRHTFASFSVIVLHNWRTLGQESSPDCLTCSKAWDGPTNLWDSTSFSEIARNGGDHSGTWAQVVIEGSEVLHGCCFSFGFVFIRENWDNKINSSWLHSFVIEQEKISWHEIYHLGIKL